MKVPRSWDKVPLENFTHFLEYQSEKPETLEQRIELVKKKSCAILGCGWEEVNGLTTEQQRQLSKLMSKPLPKRLLLSFKHKGQRYKFHIETRKRPNAYQIIEKVKEINTEEFNGGKYTAFKNVQKRGAMKNLHHLIYLTCEPIKFGFRKKFPFIGWKRKKLTPDQIEAGVISFRSLPLEVAYPIFTFFLTVSEKLKNPMEDYLSLEIVKMREELFQTQMDLENDTDG